MEDEGVTRRAALNSATSPGRAGRGSGDPQRRYILSMRILAPDTDELWAAYLACRFRCLYEPYGLPESCNTSELDSPRDRKEILHRCVVDEAGRVIGVGRLDIQPEHERGRAAQVRYFGVDAATRTRGVGRSLMRALEGEARARGCVYLWMDARDEAVGFYARLGYESLGPGPTKWGIITHTKMGKPL